MIKYKEIDWEKMEFKKYTIEDLLEIKRLSYRRYDGLFISRLLIIFSILCTILSGILFILHIRMTKEQQILQSKQGIYVFIVLLLVTSIGFLPSFLVIHTESMIRWRNMENFRYKITAEIRRRDALYFAHSRLENIFK